MLDLPINDIGRRDDEADELPGEKGDWPAEGSTSSWPSAIMCESAIASVPAVATRVPLSAAGGGS